MDECGDGFGCETERVRAARGMGSGMNFYLRAGCGVDTLKAESPGEELCPDGSDSLDPALAPACNATVSLSARLEGGDSLATARLAAPQQCCKLCAGTDGCTHW